MPKSSPKFKPFDYFLVGSVVLLILLMIIYKSALMPSSSAPSSSTPTIEQDQSSTALVANNSANNFTTISNSSSPSNLNTLNQEDIDISSYWITYGLQTTIVDQTQKTFYLDKMVNTIINLDKIKHGANDLAKDHPFIAIYTKKPWDIFGWFAQKSSYRTQNQIIVVDTNQDSKGKITTIFSEINNSNNIYSCLSIKLDSPQIDSKPNVSTTGNFILYETDQTMSIEMNLDNQLFSQNIILKTQPIVNNLTYDLLPLENCSAHLSDNGELEIFNNTKNIRLIIKPAIITDRKGHSIQIPISWNKNKNQIRFEFDPSIFDNFHYPAIFSLNVETSNTNK